MVDCKLGKIPVFIKWKPTDEVSHRVARDSRVEGSYGCFPYKIGRTVLRKHSESFGAKALCHACPNNLERG